MTRISAEDAFTGVEVEFWDGNVYETVDLPRSKEVKADEVRRKLFDGEGAPNGGWSADETVDLWGELFDLILRPIEETKSKPSTLIKKRWKADQLGAQRLMGILARMSAAEQGQTQQALRGLLERPT